MRSRVVAQDGRRLLRNSLAFENRSRLSCRRHEDRRDSGNKRCASLVQVPARHSRSPPLTASLILSQHRETRQKHQPVVPDPRERRAHTRSPVETRYFSLSSLPSDSSWGRSHYRRNPLTLLKLHQPLIETQGEHTHRLGASPDTRNRRLEKLLQNLAHVVTQSSFLETSRRVSECARSQCDPCRLRLLDQAFRLYFDQQQ